MGMGFLAIAVGVVSISCYVRKFTARVETILDAMNRVKTGNLKDRIQVDRVRDELDMIAGNFNEMCGRLELYIQKSYLAEIETKNAQMQALQSQINPHFLYNTLSAINWMAIRSNQKEISKVTLALSTFYRTALSRGEDMVTMESCIKNTEAYLEIQLVMHNHEFTVQWVSLIHI